MELENGTGLHLLEQWEVVVVPEWAIPGIMRAAGLGKTRPEPFLTESGGLKGGSSSRMARALGRSLLESSDIFDADAIARMERRITIESSPARHCAIPVIFPCDVYDFFIVGNARPLLCLHAEYMARIEDEANHRRAQEEEAGARAENATEDIRPRRGAAPRGVYVFAKIAAMILVGILAVTGLIAMGGMMMGGWTSLLEPVQVERPVAQPATPAQRETPRLSAQPLPPPTDLEIVIGSTDQPSRKLFVFSDPLCPYCKRLEPSLRAMAQRGYEIHIFPVPVHETARDLVAGIACAKDKAAAWRLAVDKEQPTTGCDTTGKADEALAFFRQFGFGSTPTLINNAGDVKIGGFQSDNELAAFIEKE